MRAAAAASLRASQAQTALGSSARREDTAAKATASKGTVFRVNKFAPPQAGGSSTEATGSRVEIERLAEQSTAQLLKMCQHILRDREEADDHSMSTACSAFRTRRGWQGLRG